MILSYILSVANTTKLFLPLSLSIDVSEVSILNIIGNLKIDPHYLPRASRHRFERMGTTYIGGMYIFIDCIDVPVIII